MSVNPIDLVCPHFDIFNGVKIKCNATYGIHCNFVDAIGNIRSLKMFHEERQDLARTWYIIEDSDPQTKKFVMALETS